MRVSLNACAIPTPLSITVYLGFCFSTGDFRFVDQGGPLEFIEVAGNNMVLDCAVHSCKDVAVTWWEWFLIVVYRKSLNNLPGSYLQKLIFG